MRIIRFVTAAIFFLLLSGGSGVHALSLNLWTLNTRPVVGEQFEVELVIDGLKTDDLSGFSLYANYDTTNLLFSGYRLGSQLGLIPDDVDDYSLGDTGGGVIDLWAVSWLQDLTNQADSFSLATLSFKATSSGISSVSLSNIVLADALGERLEIDSPDALVLSIAENMSVVPEPTSVLLLGAGIVCAGIVRRKMKSI